MPTELRKKTRNKIIDDLVAKGYNRGQPHPFPKKSRRRMRRSQSLNDKDSAMALGTSLDGQYSTSPPPERDVRLRVNRRLRSGSQQPPASKELPPAEVVDVSEVLTEQRQSTEATVAVTPLRKDQVSGSFSEEKSNHGGGTRSGRGSSSGGGTREQPSRKGGDGNDPAAAAAAGGGRAKEAPSAGDGPAATAAGGGRDREAAVGSIGDAERGDRRKKEPPAPPPPPRAAPLAAGGAVWLPPKAAWPDFPVLVRCSQEVPCELDGGAGDPLGPLPCNDASQPVRFETALFKGCAFVRLADLVTSLQAADYFAGKARKLQVVVQGTFKRRLRFGSVLSGQEFSQRLEKVPAKTLVKWAFGLLRSRLPATFHADLFGNLPYFLSPLVLASKVVRADPVARGPPPPVTALEFREDMGAHGGFVAEAGDHGGAGKQAGSGLGKAEAKAAARRRKKAADVALKLREKQFGPALDDHWFETDTVYTFDYFDSFFRADKFALDLRVKKLDLCPITGEQPLVMAMAKTADTGEYLWKFDVWHERVVKDDSPKFS